MNLRQDSGNPIDRGRLFIITTSIYSWEQYDYWHKVPTEKPFLDVRLPMIKKTPVIIYPPGDPMEEIGYPARRRR